jgi:methylaspartate mutase sigma subunit
MTGTGTGTGNGIVERGAGQHPARRRGTVVVSGLSSDAHTWNLVFLQLLIEECGYPVVNLGPCVPDEVLLGECRRLAPAMVVIGSVNGHGHRDGLRVIEKLRATDHLAATPIVIGGKLGISEEDAARHVPALMAAGFDAVFADGAAAVTDFRRFLRAAPAPALALESAGVAG